MEMEQSISHICKDTHFSGFKSFMLKESHNVKYIKECEHFPYIRVLNL